MSNSIKENIDSVIYDLNEMVKHQMTGQYISAFGIFETTIRKLISLKDKIASDAAAKDAVIESLKRTISEIERKEAEESGTV